MRRSPWLALALASFATQALAQGTPPKPAPAQPAPAQPAAPPGQPAQATPPAAVAAPLNDKELKELQHVEEIAARYGRAASEHDRRQKALLKREFDRRLYELELRYKKGLEAANQGYKLRHLRAMEELEKFLAKYPNDPKWSPDAMFRLAELYLDQAGMEWEDKQVLAQASGVVEPPPPENFDPDAPPPYQGPDYSRALALWRNIVERFPDYRQIDGTLYLLAYYLGEMGRIPEAKQVYLGLVCANKFDPLGTPPAPPNPKMSVVTIPQSSFADPYEDCKPRKEKSIVADEAWVRIGEAHFDTRGELNLAIAAYKKVAFNEKSEFFDEALYKLAWSYYRNDQFIDGINAFDKLVVYSDKQEEAGGGSVELRQESVDYIAISFADPWEKDAQPDAKKSMERAFAYYKGREKEKHVRDVFEKLGDTLRAGEAYDESIAAWRYTLEHYPLHPRNPTVHQKIVDTLADKGDAQGAMEERAKLAIAYKKGSPWYVANETNREAMDAAAKLGEQSMIAAAKSTHRRAQLAKAEYEKKPTEPAKDMYVELYKQASLLYQSYLNEFPSSSEVYELTFRLADCYYFSEQYEESVPHYRWVRDHGTLGGKYYQPAALSIVSAYEAAIDRDKKSGKLVEPPIPTVDQLKASPQPLPVPELYKKLQGAYDEYMTKINDEKTAPKTALAAAMVSHRHLQKGDALSRFQVVMDKYCSAPEAAEAFKGIDVIYSAEGDLDKVQANLERFQKKNCGTAASQAGLSGRMSGIRYERAKKAYADKQYEASADLFYELYKTAPAGDENRDDALFSAAISAQKANKPKTAIFLYGEFVRQQEFRKSEFYAESMFYTAQSHQASFDYDKAVDTYLAFVQIANEPGRTSRPEFNLEQSKADAMWNAAVLREQDRVYQDRGKNDPGAITLYKRYAATDTKDRKRAAQAYFRAALVYEKQNDFANMRKTFAEWRTKFGKDPGQKAFYVLSFYKSAKAYEKSNDKGNADKAFRETIKAFDDSGEKPGSPSAELAGEGQMWLADQSYQKTFEPYKVKWLGSMKGNAAEKTVTKTLDALKKSADTTAAGFRAVSRFESSWSLAALVRLGDVSFFAGQKLIEAPVPKEITDLDRKAPDLNVMAQYMDQIQGQVQPQTDEAKKLWLLALETAKQKGVSNKWSKLAATRLNAFIAADQYPVQRDEIVNRETLP
jgi:cellulose synthase operon protein C